MKIRVFLAVCLVLSGIVTIFFGISWGRTTWENAVCSQNVNADIRQWSIIKKNDNAYLLKADFSYLPEEKIFSNSWVFPKKYLNEGAARLAVRELKGKNFFAWYHPQKPQLALLEKNFPINDLYRFILSALIFIYFGIKFLFQHRKKV